MNDNFLQLKRILENSNLLYENKNFKFNKESTYLNEFDEELIYLNEAEELMKQEIDSKKIEKIKKETNKKMKDLNKKIDQDLKIVEKGGISLTDFKNKIRKSIDLKSIQQSFQNFMDDLKRENPNFLEFIFNLTKAGMIVLFNGIFCLIISTIIGFILGAILPFWIINFIVVSFLSSYILNKGKLIAIKHDFGATYTGLEMAVQTVSFISPRFWGASLSRKLFKLISRGSLIFSSFIGYLILKDPEVEDKSKVQKAASVNTVFNLINHFADSKFKIVVPNPAVSIS